MPQTPTPEPSYDLASTVICRELATAIEHGANHGATADRIIAAMGKAGLLVTPTPEAAPLPKYQPASPVGDLVALIRAEHWAQLAEQQLGPVGGTTVTGAHRLAHVSALAQLSQAWAWIAVVYQGPGNDTPAERMRNEGGE